MNLTVLAVSVVTLCSVALAGLPNPKKNVVHVEVDKHPGGVWKHKIVWKPRWVKEWKEERVWRAIWKKVWGPVSIQEWIPLPSPHPTWKNKH